MRLQKPDQCGEQAGLSGAGAQLICPDSGQVQEPPRPPFVRKRRRECRKGKRMGIIWRWWRHALGSVAQR